MGNFSIPQIILIILTSALGVFAIRIIVKLIYKGVCSLCRINEYDCSEDGIRPGLIQHSLGRGGTHKDAKNGRVWIHNSTHNPTQKTPGIASIYGPYTNDFSLPGFYKIQFRILGLGFEPDNKEICLLEAVQCQLTWDSQKNTTMNFAQIPLGQRIIRGKDLKSKNFQGFDVIIYSNGTGIHEYRATVYPNNFDEKRNTLLFDTIQIHRYLPIYELFS